MDYKLLKKLFEDQCSEAEKQEILRWFEDPEHQKATLDLIEKHWFDFETDYDNYDQNKIDTLKQKINTQLNLEKRKAALDPEKERITIWGSTFFRAAAIILLAISGIYLFFLVREPVNPPSPTETVNKPKTITKDNPRGQKLRVTLPDGSLVVMNAESKIDYDTQFGLTHRILELDGEAYFEVSHNLNLAFIVKAGQISVTALGTTFSIQNYPENRESTVALTSGKVSVKNQVNLENDFELFLDPGEMAVYHKTDEKVSKNEFLSESVLGWKNGLLHFENNSFSEVKTKLERWYDVEIVVQEEIKNFDWHYSGQFDNVSLEQVLEGISYTKSFVYRIEDKKVYIQF